MNLLWGLGQVAKAVSDLRSGVFLSNIMILDTGDPAFGLKKSPFPLIMG
jgi:hypothetical protein